MKTNPTILLQRAMLINPSFSYKTLMLQAGLSQTFIFKKMKVYEVKGLVKRSGMKDKQKVWRLTREGKRQFDPNSPKDPVIRTMADGRSDLQKKDRPEARLWTAILDLKRFLAEDILETRLASETTIRQYLALLVRAGFLAAKRIKSEKKGKYEGRYPVRYSVTDKAGPQAPLMGRSFYLWDPNREEYWATPMEKFDIGNGPGGAATP